jgi:hypothetical protein
MQSVFLNEEKRIIGLRLDVHAYDLEACAVVADCCPAGPAEEIKQARPH